MVKNNFVAIDFETANPQRDSACAMGIVKVFNNQIVEAKYFLIDPDTEDWALRQYKIHGIHPDNVEGEKKFDEVWELVSSIIEDSDFVVAHNVPFERSVIKACCKKYSIKIPDIHFRCSMKLSKKIYKEAYSLSRIRLCDVCDAFDIELDHHNALSDAVACARIVIKLFYDQEYGSKTGVYELSDRELEVIKEAESKIEEKPLVLKVLKLKCRTCGELFDPKSLNQAYCKKEHRPSYKKPVARRKNE